ADQDVFTTKMNKRTGLRIVEGFRKRLLPPGLLHAPSPEIGIPSKQQTAVWTPSLRPDELNQRYSKRVQSSGVPYPIYLAEADGKYKQWSEFSMKNLRLVPGCPDSSLDRDLWATFLRSRYGSIGPLNTAYRSTYSAFSEVPFPTELPRNSLPLWDWYQFQVVLPIQGARHPFTVFLPMLPGDAQSVIAHRNKLSLAQRVIELEKPAHTAYEIKFYWEFFRVGEARLGEDSVLDYGSSRAPQLLLHVVLSCTFLGSVFLNPPARG